MYNCLCTDNIDYPILCFPCDAEEQTCSVSAVSVTGGVHPAACPLARSPQSDVIIYKWQTKC
jgi:hypothetical protein